MWKIVLSRSELVQKAFADMKKSKSPEVAVFDALWPHLQSVVTRGRLAKMLETTMTDNQWGWESFEDINTKKDLRQFISDFIDLLDEEYEDDESVQFVMQN